MEKNMARKIKVSIISMNLSTNCTNRCLRLARALETDYDVELLGTTFGVGKNFGEGLWPPLQGEALEIKSVPGNYFPFYLWNMVRLVKLISGDVIIACKPRLPSFGVALIARAFKKIPVILDVDDDELAQTEPGAKEKFRNFIRNPSGYWTTRFMHFFRKSQNATISVSKFFQEIYGGVIVPHGREIDELLPDSHNRNDVLRELGIDVSKKIVGFLGTPQAAKGVDNVLKAIDKLKDEDLLFLIVGGEPADPYLGGLLESYPANLKIVGPQPLSRMSYYYAAMDVIVLPQENVSVSRGQMPAKLTDAMALAKPIIASKISDIPYYLEGCGKLVEPGNVNELANAIEWMFHNPDQAALLGSRARKVFEEKMTTVTMKEVIRKEIDRCLGFSH